MVETSKVTEEKKKHTPISCACQYGLVFLNQETISYGAVSIKEWQCYVQIVDVIKVKSLKI